MSLLAAVAVLPIERRGGPGRSSVTANPDVRTVDKQNIKTRLVLDLDPSFLLLRLSWPPSLRPTKGGTIVERRVACTRCQLYAFTPYAQNKNTKCGEIKMVWRNQPEQTGELTLVRPVADPKTYPTALEGAAPCDSARSYQHVCYPGRGAERLLLPEITTHVA